MPEAVKVTFDKKQVASFDVDAQKGFSHRCPEELPVDGAEDIVEELNLQANYARYRVASKDCHSPSAYWRVNPQHPQFQPVKGYPDLDIYWKVHCVLGTPGYELLDKLPHPSEYDFMVNKGMEPDMHPYGACYHDLADEISTGVIEWLQAKGVKAVVVGGLATDYCVAKTVQQLVAAGFHVFVNMAACRGIWATTTPEKQISQFKSWGCTVLDNSEQLELYVKGTVNPLKVLAGYAVDIHTQAGAKSFDELLDINEKFEGTWDKNSNLLVVFDDAECQGYYGAPCNNSKIININVAKRMIREARENSGL